MYTIKFSHEYFKMPPEFGQTYLIQIFFCEYSELSRAFISYDTEYKDEVGNVKEYPLPKTKLLVLVLDSVVNGQHYIWTTVRRFTPPKWGFYHGLVGQEVKIEIQK